MYTFGIIYWTYRIIQKLPYYKWLIKCTYFKNKPTHNFCFQEFLYLKDMACLTTCRSALLWPVLYPASFPFPVIHRWPGCPSPIQYHVMFPHQYWWSSTCLLLPPCQCGFVLGSFLPGKPNNLIFPTSIILHSILSHLILLFSTLLVLLSIHGSSVFTL